MKINLGLHLGFAINRYPEPKNWARLVNQKLGINHVQFVSDLLEPSFPNKIIEKQTDERVRIDEEIEKTEAEIDMFVYELYGITEDEKNVIEESLK